jgi:uncharacterized protein (DUF2345 family)
MLRVETIGMMVVSKMAKSFGIETKAKRSTTIGQNLIADVKDKILLKADKALKAVATKIEALGDEVISIESGGSQVIINKDGITMKSDQKIVISATGASEVGQNVDIA